MTDRSKSLQTPDFEYELELALKLDAQGKSIDINSGHIDSFELDLHPYGYKGKISFTAFDEKSEPIFSGPESIKISLTFKSEEHTPLLEIQGLAKPSSFKREPTAKASHTKPICHYEFEFCDPAQATWEEHFPINIYVDTSMKEVVEKQKGEIKIDKYEWSAFETKHPIIAFSLATKDELPKSTQKSDYPLDEPPKPTQTSFYSFLFWYLHKENGIFTYDYKGNTYSLAGKKNKAAGKPVEIYEGWVLPLKCIPPKTVRHNTKKRKVNFDSMESDDKDAAKPYSGVNKVSIHPENYIGYPEQAYEAIQSTPSPEKNTVEVQFVNMLKLIIDKLIPGSPVCFHAEDEGNWSKDARYKGKTFQVQHLKWEAHKHKFSQPLPKTKDEFHIQLKLVLEEDGEPFVPRPDFVPPTYPFATKGKIFSGIGDEEQSTYDIKESDKAPDGQYQIELPLVEDKKKLLVPFTPDLLPGQFFFPYTKGQRVEVAMWLHTGKILRASGWQQLTRPPKGKQIHQILLASNGKDKYTRLTHEFEGNKNSVFTIERSTSDTKKETFKIKEQDIAITVEEQNKQTLLLHIDKGSVTLSLENKSDGVTQSVVLNGKTITYTCKGKEGTTTITQTPDTVTIDTKKFIVNATEMIFNAKDKISMTAQNNLTLKAKTVDVPADAVNMGS